MEPWPTIPYVSIVGYEGAYLGPECFLQEKAYIALSFLYLCFL